MITGRRLLCTFLCVLLFDYIYNNCVCVCVYQTENIMLWASIEYVYIIILCVRGFCVYLKLN